MTSPQNYTVVPMPKPEVGTQLQSGVQCKCDYVGVDLTASNDVSRSEYVEFLKLLRRVLVEVTRWIERRYPETTKN
jgi:hypothetical protein